MQHRPPLLPYSSFAFAAEPPELPTRREGDTGSLEYVARAEVADEHERGITLVGTTQNDEPITASITVIAPGVVRILLEGREHDPNRVTLAGDVSDAAVNLALEKADGQVTLVSDEVTVRVDLDPFHVAFYGPDGTPVLDQNYEETNVADYTTVLPFGFSTVDGERPVYHDTFTTEPDEHFYGFGEKFSGLDKRGQQLEMWNNDSYGAHTERAIKNVPFFMSSRGYAVFVDSVTHVNFDMAASNNATFSIVVPDTGLDYYVIVGSDSKTIITRYAELVGLPILPPKWARLCGHAFWSHDIGGFHRQPTPELYVRWAQFGLLSPLSRAHGMTTRLPWDYGEEALRIFRDFTRLRYRLLAYIYTYASIAAETSVPIMRPMLLEFPTDSCVHGTDLQYMFGSELLVAPIYNSQGQRRVYLPSGRWVDYWTREVIEGPRMLHVEATLDTLPLYVRADALVPTVETLDHLIEDPFEMVTFDCYLIDEGTFELRDTDGVTRVEASFTGTRLEIALEGAKQKIGLHLIPLPDAPQVETVRSNGSDLEMVESLRLDLNSGVGWTSDPDGAVRVVVG